METPLLPSPPRNNTRAPSSIARSAVHAIFTVTFVVATTPVWQSRGLSVATAPRTP